MSLAPPAPRTDARFLALSAAVVLLIVYGSLYPFEFHSTAANPVQALLETWNGPVGRGDFGANVLFYFPLGLFLAHALPRRSVAFAVLAGAALSVCMELLQFYDAGRISALSDVYANTLGAAAGAAASLLLSRTWLRLRPGAIERLPFAMLLLACWLGYRLFPFVPVIDLHKYWTALKPLIFAPVLPPVDVLRHIAAWLAVALLIEALAGTLRSRQALPFLLAAMLAARIVIIGAVLSPAEVVGGALAVLAWEMWIRRLRRRTLLIAIFLAAVVAVQTLQPFEFSPARSPFGWIPFRGFLHGSLEINARSFLEKTFTYGALLWLLTRAGCGLPLAIAGTAAFVFCLRLGQMFLPGRSAEITDPVMVLLIGVVLRLTRENSLARRGEG